MNGTPRSDACGDKKEKLREMKILEPLVKEEERDSHTSEKHNRFII